MFNLYIMIFFLNNLLKRIEISQVKYDRDTYRKDFKDAKATLNLSNIVNDSQNHALRELKAKYPSFFDEESGNNTKEGLKQVVDYLQGEYSKFNWENNKLKKELKDLETKLANSKKLTEESAESSNVNFLFSLIASPLSTPRYLFLLIRTALPYFSLAASLLYILGTNFFPDVYFLSFIQNVVDFIKSVIKYEIAVSLSVLIWSLYSYGKKIKKTWLITKFFIDFIRSSYYIDIWILLIIFIITICF